MVTPIYTTGGEPRHCESTTSCPITQHSDLAQPAFEPGMLNLKSNMPLGHGHMSPHAIIPV